MKITLLASFLVMAAYFLLLYAGVGLIQEKKFFSSAPREVFAAVPERKAERFRGAHILGWCLGILAMLLFLGAAASPRGTAFGTVSPSVRFSRGIS